MYHRGHGSDDDGTLSLDEPYDNAKPAFGTENSLATTLRSATLLLSKKLAVIITALLVGYTARTLYIGAAKRRGYGPFLMCCFSIPLVLSQPVLQVLQSLRYYNSYGPMTSFINFISWMGLFQMSTASMWNASLDVTIITWYTKKFVAEAPLSSSRYEKLPEIVPPVAEITPEPAEEEECGA
ncbi:hypothetical protein THRCLA_07028 [Thraustotheca clavata]|uniref:Transmembrane protein n=1 Tax=Thraustotheca clavata TaxID=74557 RepID=A0A1V9ZH26_9STRA|nr:hypothetical protein THRCLA_07028 [Thraustotheca clavata]